MLRTLFDAVRNGNIYVIISIVMSSCILLFICLPMHELAHAWMAHKLGDNTAKYQGRLSLNPLRHLDVLGSLMILLVGVGYAKPVPVNIMNFRNRKRDMALTAAAGPICNLLMSVVFTFLYVVLGQFVVFPMILSGNVVGAPYLIADTIHTALFYAGFINLSLAIFNLIPIPPFDGSRILGYFLSDRLYYKIMQYERVIFIFVLVLLAGGFMSGPLSSFINYIFNGLYRLLSLPFGGVMIDAQAFI